MGVGATGSVVGAAARIDQTGGGVPPNGGMDGSGVRREPSETVGVELGVGGGEETELDPFGQKVEADQTRLDEYFPRKSSPSVSQLIRLLTPKARSAIFSDLSEQAAHGADDAIMDQLFPLRGKVRTPPPLVTPLKEKEKPTQGNGAELSPIVLFDDLQSSDVGQEEPVPVPVGGVGLEGVDLNVISNSDTGRPTESSTEYKTAEPMQESEEEASPLP